MALIDIGSSKQLFLDDYLIESMTNTRQVMNPAQKVGHNPIIQAERPWEGNSVNMSRVYYDDVEGLFKMLYSGGTMKARQGKGEIIVEGEGEGVTCLAVSDDGYHWERPNLGLVEFDGSRDNNILPASHLLPGGDGGRYTTYFFQDHHDEDPARRYKGFVRTGSTTEPGMIFDLYYSKNGFQWTPYEGNPVIDTTPRVGRWGPTTFMGWDPIRETYAVHLENCLHRRCPQGKRLIGRAESPDLVNWSDPETIIVPDEQDTPDTEFYSLKVMAYEGLYIGMLWIFRTTNTTHHPELVISRDGVHYQRNYREPFVVRSASPEFDSTSLYVYTQLVHDDVIFTYYTGTNWRSPEQLVALGDKAVHAVGLATTPLDGFVSLDGAKGGPSKWVARDVEPYSQMVTRSFSFSGSRLHVNMQSALQQWGAEECEVRVQVLSPNHEPLDGFGFDDADPLTTTGHDHVVSWKGNSDLSRLAGQPIKLRFYFKNAKLYSFQFGE